MNVKNSNACGMKALFSASRENLGSRMIMENLREEGFEIGRERTRRLMKVLNLKVKQKYKYKVTTNSKHKLPVAENVMKRSLAKCPGTVDHYSIYTRFFRRNFELNSISENNAKLLFLKWCPGPESNRHGVSTEGF